MATIYASLTKNGQTIEPRRARAGAAGASPAADAAGPGIFIRTDLVVNPGWGQVRDTILVTARLPADIALRTLIALLALVPLFHPSLAYAITAGVLVAALLVVGVIHHRKVAKPAAQSPNSIPRNRAAFS